jgi:NADH-quinone oxidoreductase subunit G
LTGAEVARLAGAGAVVALATTETEGTSRADLVLPVTTLAEENGTYVNVDHRVQRFQQAISPPGMARPAWWLAGEVLVAAGETAEAPATAAEAFAALGASYPAFAGLTHQELGFTGRVLRSALARAAR